MYNHILMIQFYKDVSNSNFCFNYLEKIENFFIFLKIFRLNFLLTKRVSHMHFREKQGDVVFAI